MVTKKKPSAQRTKPRTAHATAQAVASHSPSHGIIHPANWRNALWLTFFIILARMVYVSWLSPYGLGPDEAQYWHWKTHLDWSYLSKPPLTTWLIAASTAVLGDSPLGVKFFALLGQGAAALLAFALAGRLAGIRAAWSAYLIFTTVPLVAAGGLLMSPDAIMLPLWMAALLVLSHQADEKHPAWKPWLAIAVIIGLAGLAKYTALLFYPLLGLFMLVERRDWFRKPHIYVAGLITLALQTPVISWNLTHGGEGLAHLIWQTDGGGDTRHGGFGTMGEFLLGQALVLGPVIFPLTLFIWAMGARFHHQLALGMRLLLVFTLPVFAAFLLQTLNAKVQPNWPLLATVPALVMVAVAISGHFHRLKAVLVLGLVINAMLTLVLHDTFILKHVGINLPIKADPTREMRGWPQAGAVTSGLLARLQPDTVILTTRYQTAAELAFHTPGNPTVLYMNPGGRRANQYDLWEWPSLDGQLVLYINEQNNLPEAVANRFSQCTPWQRFRVEEQGQIIREASTWLCWNTALASL